MSHFKERAEKNCLNCNAEVKGRYCYVCGQQNTPPKQTIGHLISHFLEDVTHFDGKFFFTLGTLIRRPGILTLEYVRGRKATYLDPVRMYIFTSAFFFLIFFKTTGPVDDSIKISGNQLNAAAIENLSDSAVKAYSLEKYDTLLSRKELIQKAEKKEKTGQFISFTSDSLNHTSTGYYDSTQEKLTPDRRDGFAKKYINRRLIRLNEIYKENPKGFTTKIVERFFHLLPQMLFASLPLFALLLKLLYNRRKQFYYTDHVLFTIHLYIFTFIIILLLIILKKFDNSASFNAIDFIQRLLMISILFYQYKAMRNFYGQRRGKTIAKFLLLNLMAFFLLIFLAVGFVTFGLITLE